eukprot:3337445-Pleurochrysis_carterae.AAC.10
MPGPCVNSSMITCSCIHREQEATTYVRAPTRAASCRRTLKMRVEAEMTQRKVRKSANGSARPTPCTAAPRHDRTCGTLCSSRTLSQAMLAAVTTKISPIGQSALDSRSAKYPPV